MTRATVKGGAVLVHAPDDPHGVIVEYGGHWHGVRDPGEMTLRQCVAFAGLAAGAPLRVLVRNSTSEYVGAMIDRGADGADFYNVSPDGRHVVYVVTVNARGVKVRR